jgi:hypothetical protein
LERGLVRLPILCLVVLDLPLVLLGMLVEVAVVVCKTRRMCLRVVGLGVGLLPRVEKVVRIQLELLLP